MITEYINALHCILCMVVTKILDLPYTMYTWMVGWLDGWMVGWLDGWMVGWLDGWMVGWLDGLMIGPLMNYLHIKHKLYMKDLNYLPGFLNVITYWILHAFHSSVITHIL